MLRHATYWLQRLANPPIFVIRICDGTARLTKGLAPPGFLNDCAAIAEDLGMKAGDVECINGPHGITLRFSPGVAASGHQRFRNALGTHRHKI